MKLKTVDIIAAEGEGQRIEFKEGLARLDREIVAFANTSGGSVFIGIRDDGTITGTDCSNRRRSEILDLGRNCDPPINLRIVRHVGNVLEVAVEEGNNKPYRCKDGFFLREGPSCQKLGRDEIVMLILRQGNYHYDEIYNSEFSFPKDFDAGKLDRFMKLCNVSIKADPSSILLSLDCAKIDHDAVMINNAAILFFAKQPQRLLKESYVTCVRYAGADRLNIIDRKDLYGDIITLIEESLSFIERHTSVEQRVVSGQARHQYVYEYPLTASREAVINAVMHRDYFNDSSHIFIHIFSDRMEIENPGGLSGGLTLEELGERSVRRNRTIADLLYRAGFVEKIGSGIQRMQQALSENNNPPLSISSTNYFVVRFYPRVITEKEVMLSTRQAMLLQALRNRDAITVKDAVGILGVSGDTALRELRELQTLQLTVKDGVGRSTRYRLKT
jgi:ATP-dependent DNA helicase RecG